MRVKLAKKDLSEYRDIIGNEKISEIKKKAHEMRGLDVLHFNSTSFGGGVAEMLHSIVPLMGDVGLDAEWKTMNGEDTFFEVTKTLHNGLQGMQIDLTEAMKKTYRETNRRNGDFGDHDVVVIHDPQPAAIITSRKEGKWIWRCHIDTSQSNQQFVKFMKPYISQYNASIFTLKEYANGIYGGKRFYIPPSIDPLSDKNRDLTENERERILAAYGIDTDTPILLQVSRFDPWKDPLGVIDAYRIVRKRFSSQLVLIGSMAQDDPEGVQYYEKTKKYVRREKDIHLLTNLDAVEVNAFQRAAAVVIQKSVREGFGLTVTEALWKEKPVVATRVGGIPLQIDDGHNGFLVESTKECAEKILYLIKNSQKAKEIGEKAKETVRDKFLVTRHLHDYLLTMEALQ
jgi:trehalose synthase